MTITLTAPDPTQTQTAFIADVEPRLRLAPFAPIRRILERLGDFKAERDAGDPVEDQEIQFFLHLRR